MAFMKSLLSLLALVLFVSCSSSRKEEKKRNEEIHAKVSQLKIGLTADEVMAIHPNLGNCTGQKASIQVCEWRFFRSTDGPWISPAPYTTKAIHAKDMPSYNQGGPAYELQFEKNQLKRWKRLGDERS